MTSIQKATKKDYDKIVSIGRISVTEAHKDSCSAEILNEYIERNYNAEEIQNELSNLDNIYHIIKHNDNPVGFSKIVLNASMFSGLKLIFTIRLIIKFNY